MLNNVYIVASPTQLMSAIEAKATNIGNNFLIINYGQHNRLENKQQMQKLVGSSSWDKVYRIHLLSNKYINHLLILYYALKFKFKFKNRKTKAYIGEYRSFLFCLLARVISIEKETLLDDGAVILMLQKKYFSKGVGLRTYYKNNNSYTTFLIYSYLFSFNFDDSAPDLFSSFNLNKWLSIGQINERIADVPYDVKTLDCFCFFGAKYSEAGIFSLEVELELLKFSFAFIRNKYGKPISYMAHRDDSDVKLEAIRALGVEVKRLASPCEVYFKVHQYAPKFIGGFYTTSIITLPSLFRIDGVLSFDLSEYIEDEKTRENTRHVYDYLNDNGVNVIKVILST
ncbi:hypothetical protein GCM10007916_00990 [Psychromonas marina]|uniref:Uncharacterized protein n=1 Tax=Psychromonas marina TaxID=88364 RepID=A0ABQ6DVB0_9GAMM|nr:hypothetical protein [Psychromonas marina]GLS89032.1 hypothetical protein GCM10007916_00990 [Psychromonas marina]